MNQVGLVGRMIKDPELRYYNEKRPFTTFTLAINRSYKNNQGNVEADFIQCCAWGKLAETISKYCGKGSLVGVNGRLNVRSFTNQQNIRVYTVDVVAEDVRFYTLKEPGKSFELSGFVQAEGDSPQKDSDAKANDAITKSSDSSVVAETTERLQTSKKAKGGRELPIPM